MGSKWSSSKTIILAKETEIIENAYDFMKLDVEEPGVFSRTGIDVENFDNGMKCAISSGYGDFWDARWLIGQYDEQKSLLTKDFIVITAYYEEGSGSLPEVVIGYPKSNGKAMMICDEFKIRGKWIYEWIDFDSKPLEFLDKADKNIKKKVTDEFYAIKDRLLG